MVVIFQTTFRNAFVKDVFSVILISLRFVPKHPIDNKSVLVHIIAWCHHATSHYLNQWWSRFLTPYGVTRLQWVKLSLSYTVIYLAESFCRRENLQAFIWFRVFYRWQNTRNQVNILILLVKFSYFNMAYTISGNSGCVCSWCCDHLLTDRQCCWHFSRCTIKLCTQRNY